MCEKHVFFAAVKQNERSQNLVWISTPHRGKPVLFCVFQSHNFWSYSRQLISFQKTKHDFSTLWQAFSAGYVSKRLLLPLLVSFPHPPRIRRRIGMYSYPLASWSVCQANIRRRTNTLSKTWGKYASVGRTPSQKHEASIRPWTNTI